MIRVSKPILYTVVLGTVAYAVTLATEPKTITPKTAVKKTTAAIALSSDYTAEDETARFPRYVKRGRDAFLPGVKPLRGMSGMSPINLRNSMLQAIGNKGTWRLTGINAINSSYCAVIENDSTQEIKFLKTGDRWDGLQVISIAKDNVEFLNALNQQTHLSFSDPQSNVAPVSRTNTSGPITLTPENTLRTAITTRNEDQKGGKQP